MEFLLDRRDSPRAVLCVLCVASRHLQELLDEAQAQLEEGAARLCMPVQLIRKTRSVGVVPTQATIYEVGGGGALTHSTGHCRCGAVQQTGRLPRFLSQICPWRMA